MVRAYERKGPKGMTALSSRSGLLTGANERQKWVNLRHRTLVMASHPGRLVGSASDGGNRLVRHATLACDRKICIINHLEVATHSPVSTLQTVVCSLNTPETAA